ncbi:MAG: hypothetical protein M3P93_18085 [Actinomycetota bacterium]|nr:hypothetical protein [Actinomycetota bacterium]
MRQSDRPEVAVALEALRGSTTRFRLEVELARLAPLPVDVHDRLVPVAAEGKDKAEWAVLVPQVVRGAEVHLEAVLISRVVVAVEVPAAALQPGRAALPAVMRRLHQPLGGYAAGAWRCCSAW